MLSIMLNVGVNPLLFGSSIFSVNEDKTDVSFAYVMGFTKVALEAKWNITKMWTIPCSERMVNFPVRSV